MPTESSSDGLAMGGSSFARLNGNRCFFDFNTFFTLPRPLASRIPLRLGGSERSQALMSTMSSPSITPARACLSLLNITRRIGLLLGSDPVVDGAGVGGQPVAEGAQLERGGIVL